MNILLTGAAGQLGTELIPLLSSRGRLFKTDRSAAKRADDKWLSLDVSDGRGVDNVLQQAQPSLIVNAAAYTAVDQAEKDVDASYVVNAEFPGRLAHWARQNDAVLVHYSTDYVFNGEASRPYRETDQPDPQSVYGKSKLAGEQVIIENNCRHAIIRTAWIYSSHGKNFVLSMLNLARKGVQLGVVDDQKGCPTWAGSLARASDQLIQQLKRDSNNGIYHYCDDRTLTWYEFAAAIFEYAMEAGLLCQLPELRPVTSAEYLQPASRPQWSVLDTKKISDTFNIEAASFSQSLRTVIDEIKVREAK